MPPTIRWSLFRERNTGANIDMKKKAYLDDAHMEAISSHPEIPPPSLICPISLTLMKEPVITAEGHVYDKDNILKSLLLDSRDPLTRTTLFKEQLYAFPELISGPIDMFVARQILYLKNKQALLEDARRISHGEQANEYPPLFICPISQTIIMVPVITCHGKIYDRQSLTCFLRENQNIDETGLPMGPKDYQLFPEFHQQIRLYLLYRKDMPQLSAENNEQHVAYCSLL